MPQKPIRDCRDFGLEFYVFLEKTRRNNIIERGALDNIYNGEFRNNKPGFPFSAILYGLSRFGKVRVKHGNIVFFLKKIHNLKWSQPTRDDIADKNGIEIYSSDHQFKDGTISLRLDNKSEHTEHLYIENTGNVMVRFMDCALLRGLADFSLDFEHNRYPLDLPPGHIHKIDVRYTACGVGVESAMLALEFQLQTSFTSFYIVRFIEAKCKTTQGKKLCDTAPNRPRSIPAWTPPAKATIVYSQLPEEDMIEKIQKSQAPLPDYELPDDLNSLILALRYPASYCDPRQSTLKAPLSINNYAENLFA
ncbi:hypothetical protein WMY93_027395 [Mugilogobius chulae]|uniref:Uncharacterized protein n=1 Tax=Mugilogobius chulae TaxID=88201 RepID=A0AAW0MX65_9GOBI